VGHQQLIQQAAQVETIQVQDQLRLERQIQVSVAKEHGELSLHIMVAQVAQAL
jgi:hypothetical protein